jgi:hypothetical protein
VLDLNDYDPRTWSRCEGWLRFARVPAIRDRSDAPPRGVPAPPPPRRPPAPAPAPPPPPAL